MAQEITDTQKMDSKVIEQVLIGGDLSKLNTEQRTAYYSSVCQSLGLNPLTKPFDYITLNGKLTLYARKDCTEQLRNMRKLSLKITSREIINDVYIVTAQAVMPDGRCDESTGAVNVKGIAGEALANAYMKAETKSKRRVTLSICGLGMLDESEVDSIPAEQTVDNTKRPVKPATEEKKTTSKKLADAVKKPEPVADDAEIVTPKPVTPPAPDALAVKSVLFEKITSKKEADGKTKFGAKLGEKWFGTYDGKIADFIQQSIAARWLINVSYTETVKDDVTYRMIVSAEQSDLADAVESGEIEDIPC